MKVQTLLTIGKGRNTLLTLLKLKLLFALKRDSAGRRVLANLLQVFVAVWAVTGLLIPPQEPARAQAQTSTLKSEFIAPGIEHLQITRGYKSDISPLSLIPTVWN